MQLCSVTDLQQASQSEVQMLRRNKAHLYRQYADSM